MNTNRPSPVGQVLRVVVVALWTVSSARALPGSVPSAEDNTPAESMCVYGGSSGALWLVQMDSVGKELALTPAQTQRFAAMADELRAETGRLSRGLLGGTGPEHEQRVAEKARQAAAITETFHRQVIERLERPQRVRLDELYVRYLGPRALFEPRVAACLALSQSQQQALRDAVSSGTTPPPFEELLGLLTAQQRQQLTALQGRPFTFPKPRFIRLQPGPRGRDG